MTEEYNQVNTLIAALVDQLIHEDLIKCGILIA
jgi:hypothetical protein